MEVRDFMIYDVIKVKKSDTVRDLLKKLVKHKIGGVPVVDDSDVLVGMVSDGDVLRALSPKEETVIDFYTMVFLIEKQETKTAISKVLDKTVESIMTQRRIYDVHPEDAFEKVLNILSRHHFKKIPVTNGAGRVVGVISRGDIIRFINKQIAEN
ncbi:CBS domain-containing protein [Pullulanibacillus camelliae]|uniref:CBS domain-containing protein n=1 Tax=Pullulanibacillus camelliae TaxID=1707096 RepID=A0A8J2YPF6_9BACL|nr:CBS domain-containing protein [Pullulanibacillus camelliae]GGE56977.1 CBS domain-containing protein [Pullulanibacillus camelliae]